MDTNSDNEIEVIGSSVHANKTDPSRGQFILYIDELITSFGPIHLKRKGSEDDELVWKHYEDASPFFSQFIKYLQNKSNLPFLHQLAIEDKCASNLRDSWAKFVDAFTGKPREVLEPKFESKDVVDGFCNDLFKVKCYLEETDFTSTDPQSVSHSLNVIKAVDSIVSRLNRTFVERPRIRNTSLIGDHITIRFDTKKMNQQLRHNILHAIMDEICTQIIDDIKEDGRLNDIDDENVDVLVPSIILETTNRNKVRLTPTMIYDTIDDGHIATNWNHDICGEACQGCRTLPVNGFALDSKPPNSDTGLVMWCTKTNALAKSQEKLFGKDGMAKLEDVPAHNSVTVIPEGPIITKKRSKEDIKQPNQSKKTKKGQFR